MPGVVGLFVSHLAVHFQHSVVMRVHVVGDGPGKGILGVGVDVHLDHAVVDGLVDIIQFRTRAAVKHQVKPGRSPYGLTTASWHSRRIAGLNWTAPGL